jgi:hypothetical protein
MSKKFKYVPSSVHCGDDLGGGGAVAPAAHPDSKYACSTPAHGIEEVVLAGGDWSNPSASNACVIATDSDAANCLLSSGLPRTRGTAPGARS